jgi:hypothetical protein
MDSSLWESGSMNPVRNYCSAPELLFRSGTTVPLTTQSFRITSRQHDRADHRHQQQN